MNRDPSSVATIVSRRRTHQQAHVGDGAALAREMAWRNMAMILGHWQLRGYGIWAVVVRESGEFIGRVGCWNPAGWPGFEIGWLLHRACWGQGYATEAARAALRYSFEELRQPAVISLIHPDNRRSISVALRLGEELSGETELYGRPALIYRITHDEWSAAART